MNKNDLLGNLYFYNAKALGIMTQFIVIVYYLDGTSDFLDQCIYDEATDRLVFMNAETVCLPNVDRIIVSKFN